MRNRGIAFKLILLILTSSTLIFAVVFGYNYLFSRRIIVKKDEENARNLALATVNRIDVVLCSMEKVPENLACFLEHSHYSKNELRDFIRLIVENNPEIYGSTVAFEPYAFDKDSLYFAPYFYKSEGKIKFAYLGGASYRYFYWDWYQIPKELHRPVWSEPYYDEGGGNIIMSTYSAPFYKTVSGKRQFIGVVTADVSLSWLQELVASIRIAQTGYGFLLSKNGTFVTHPHEHLIMNETIFSVAEARGDARLREIGRQMIGGKTGFVSLNSMVTGKKCWMVYAPLPSNGWSLGVLFPQDELMADIIRLNRTMLFLGLAGFLFLLVVIVSIAGSITRPLRALAGATEDIATGNLDIELPPIKSRDEVGKLGESFTYMKSSLKQYIKELTETTAAKERIESELKIAAEIQASLLPRTFPPFPKRKEFDIFATMDPAKEVGGDFYDFFFIDENKLCFLIGDVSGKGVPASLFMAVTRTLIKTKTIQGLTPDIVLSRVNEDLCIDNDACMFVTMLYAILNIQTGEIQFANAGHNPPLIYTGDGDFEFIPVAKNFVVGAMENTTFESQTLTFKPNDVLFIYTDGVTEAMNPEGQLFSDERLKQTLAKLKAKDITDIIHGIRAEIDIFVQGTLQSDDITMLALKFNGKGV